MKSIRTELTQRMAEAIEKVGASGDPLVRPVQDERFGDYQSNCAMPLAKQLGRKPRELAEELVKQLRVDDLCEPPEIAGPGFINFRLKPQTLAGFLESIPPCDDPAKDRLGIPPADAPQVVVVDLSSPNLAKEMHVGHLRSTVIGDCVARVLEFEGHNVIRENHVGDWGTQFGMLVAHLRATRPDVVDNPDRLRIGDLESFYVEAKDRFDADESFRRESRETVVALQKGDPTTGKIWKAFCDESLRHCHAIYDRLGVKLIDRGESFYTDLMDKVIRRLEAIRQQEADGSEPSRDRNGAGFVRVSEGALCLFMEGFQTRDGEPLPMIVRKSDGGYNYATSDLATLIHRIEHLHATRVIYVVGHPQKQHFEMLFAAARRAGWAGENVSLEHLAFGSVLAPDGAPFKTREGGTIKLKDLLDTAVERARRVIEEAKDDDTRVSRSLSPQEVDEVAERVGLAAVKYFDLSHALNSDYKFDLDSMVSMEGNTAPYMLYAYARIRSIARKAAGKIDLVIKGGVDSSGVAHRFSGGGVESPTEPRPSGSEGAAHHYSGGAVDSSSEPSRTYPAPGGSQSPKTPQGGISAGSGSGGAVDSAGGVTHHFSGGGAESAVFPPSTAILLQHPSEIQLAKKLAQFPDVLADVSADLRPNLLTDYLYDLSKAFSRFYDRKLGVRVIDASPDEVRHSRLRLCDTTARVLRLGLHLLGIETVEQM